jgi:hypothetical protein
VAIDQCAEAATGNLDFFLNQPHSIGSKRKTGGFITRRRVAAEPMIEDI